MGVVGRLIQLFGIVRASRHAAVVEQLRKAEARGARLSRDLDETRSLTRERKARVEALAQSLKQAQLDGQGRQRDIKRVESDLRRTRRQLERAQGDLVRSAEHLVSASADNSDLRARLAPLKTRIATAERDLALARESLMTVEVKLDILEGAARALDQRTRGALAPDQGSGASV